jgi:O-methyltransferase involved in polyketide biosynthesis
LPRALLFDRWVPDFLSAHPDTTVVEIGTGLNTRHERVDNGRSRWHELDLPGVIDLRRHFSADILRRTVIAVSVTDRAWAAEMASHPRVHPFVAEAVQAHLYGPDVRRVIDLLADCFPGVPCRPWTPPALVFFDTEDQKRRPRQGRGPYALVLP